MKRMTYQNIYKNLLTQADKIRKHNRQGSCKTKDRYFAAYKRFLQYLAIYFHLQKISNIKAKHIYPYVAYMQEKYQPSTIKTDLAAIRFWQDKIPDYNEVLPTNEDLNLGKRRYGTVDRSWSLAEFAQVLAKATLFPTMDYAEILTIARYNGLRVHEIFRLDTATCENALKYDVLTIKGKGGKVREVPLAPETKNSFTRMLVKTTRGDKLFLKKDVQHM